MALLYDGSRRREEAVAQQRVDEARRRRHVVPLLAYTNGTATDLNNKRQCDLHGG
jgi:hypothetical protein